MFGNSDTLEKNEILRYINLKYDRRFEAERSFREKSKELFVGFFYMWFVVSRYLSKVIVFWTLEIKVKRLPQKNHVAETWSCAACEEEHRKSFVVWKRAHLLYRGFKK